MKCTVIDDEPYALELIKDYVVKTPFLELAECFSNPLKAISYLTSVRIDLIFLDINMPEISGIQLLNSLPDPPMVIFTTAYPEYGAVSYDYSAVDYLIKPIKYDRFLKSANKAVELLHKKGVSYGAETEKPVKDKFIFIKSGTRLLKVNPADILYVEGAGNYMTFYTTEKKFLSLMTIMEVLHTLPSEMFVRIHKSYVVSVRHIDAIEKHDVIIKGKPVPIGITYREQFLQKMGK